MENVVLERDSDDQGLEILSYSTILPVSLSPSGIGVSFIEHHVSKMDTLAGIAIKYGVEVADIKRINGLVRDLQMFSLRTLQIPLPGRHPPSPCLLNGYETPQYLQKLKHNVRNKAKVEGSICNAYLVEEASAFCEHYFNQTLHRRHRRMPRNVESHTGEGNDFKGNLSIFTHPGRPFGRHRTRMLSEQEINVAHRIHILENISRIITNIFKERLHVSGYNWKMVPHDIKDFYWQEFQKHYQWDTSLDALVKVAWHKKVSRRYSNDVNRWKDHNQRPSFISESIWEAWQCYWESPEFQKKSAQGSMNRMSETRNERAGPSRYTSGSLSHREHAKRLDRVVARYEAKTAAVREDGSSSQLVDATQIYLDEVG